MKTDFILQSDFPKDSDMVESFECQQTQTKFLRVIIKTIFIQNLVKRFVLVGFFFFYILVMLREQCLKQVVALRTEHSKR